MNEFCCRCAPSRLEFLIYHFSMKRKSDDIEIGNKHSMNKLCNQFSIFCIFFFLRFHNSCSLALSLFIVSQFHCISNFQQDSLNILNRLAKMYKLFAFSDFDFAYFFLYWFSSANTVYNELIEDKLLFDRFILIRFYFASFVWTVRALWTLFGRHLKMEFTDPYFHFAFRFHFEGGATIKLFNWFPLYSK